VINTRSHEVIVSTLSEPLPYRLHWLGDDAFLYSADHGIWSIRRDGTEHRHLAFLDSFQLVDVANNGRHVLLIIPDRGNANIFVGDLQQGTVTQILGYDIGCPVCWSPTSQLIACLGSGEREVWLVDSDGAHPRSFMTVDYHQASHFAWSPDGRAIAALRGLGGGGPGATKVGVFVKDIQTSEQRKVLTLYREQGNCVWMSDSQGFLYTHAVEWMRDIRRLTSRYVETERLHRETIRCATLNGHNDEILGIDHEFISIRYLISV
jgi:Tol biopolymer transport system component